MSLREKLPWDNSRIRDDTRQKLLDDKILELTVSEKNYSKQQIANLVNRSVSFVWLTWKRLAEQGRLEKDPETGHIKKNIPIANLRTFAEIEKTEFGEIESINKWIKSMKSSNIQNYPTQVSNFWKICKTINVHPDSFLISIEESKNLYDDFVEKFRKGEAVYIYKSKKTDVIKQANANPQAYTEALKSFMTRNGMVIPEGQLRIERDSTMIYGRVHLNDEERRQGIAFFSEVAPKFLTLFILHHELGGRINSILKMHPVWNRKTIEVDGVECEYYTCMIYEKKQKETFEKIVVTPEARHVVKTLKNGDYFHSETNIRNAKDEYNKLLRQFYALIGKISPDPKEQAKYERLTQEWYYVNDSSHVLRHSSIHKMMRMCGERQDVVKTFFFDGAETLKIYARSTIDSILHQGMCFVCKKPNTLDPKYERFCTLRHAILYYNEQEKQQAVEFNEKIPDSDENLTNNILTNLPVTST